MILCNNERTNRARTFMSHPQCLVSAKTSVIQSSYSIESPQMHRLYKIDKNSSSVWINDSHRHDGVLVRATAL